MLFFRANLFVLLMVLFIGRIKCEQDQEVKDANAKLIRENPNCDTYEDCKAISSDLSSTDSEKKQKGLLKAEKYISDYQAVQSALRNHSRKVNNALNSRGISEDATNELNDISDKLNNVKNANTVEEMKTQLDTIDKALKKAKVFKEKEKKTQAKQILKSIREEIAKAPQNSRRREELENIQERLKGALESGEDLEEVVQEYKKLKDARNNLIKNVIQKMQQIDENPSLFDDNASSILSKALLYGSNDELEQALSEVTSKPEPVTPSPLIEQALVELESLTALGSKETERKDIVKKLKETSASNDKFTQKEALIRYYKYRADRQSLESQLRVALNAVDSFIVFDGLTSENEKLLQTEKYKLSEALESMNNEEMERELKRWNEIKSDLFKQPHATETSTRPSQGRSAINQRIAEAEALKATPLYSNKYYEYQDVLSSLKNAEDTANDSFAVQKFDNYKEERLLCEELLDNDIAELRKKLRRSKNKQEILKRIQALKKAKDYEDNAGMKEAHTEFQYDEDDDDSSSDYFGNIDFSIFDWDSYY